MVQPDAAAAFPVAWGRILMAPGTAASSGISRQVIRWGVYPPARTRLISVQGVQCVRGVVHKRDSLLWIE